MKHNVQVGWVVDGTNVKGDTFYIRLLFCDKCHTAGKFIRMPKELDDCPVISRSKYKILNDWPDECQQENA